jgi:hypothetical protein
MIYVDRHDYSAIYENSDLLTCRLLRSQSRNLAQVQTHQAQSRGILVGRKADYYLHLPCDIVRTNNLDFFLSLVTGAFRW